MQWLALSHAPRARRLSRRRHGPRQDHSGARAAAHREAARAGRRAEPSRRAGVAARQLGGGGGALRAVPAGPRRPSRLHGGRGLKAVDAGQLLGRRSRRDQLRHAAAPRLASPRRKWRFVVLDEAQAIKNPGAKQTRAVKALRGQARIALTGTPIENNLRDLWSIFDFINPGPARILQGFRGFRQAPRRAAEPPSYAPLKQARGALYSAPPQDRQQRHRRPARQDGGEGLLRAHQEAGGALPGDGRRAGAAAEAGGRRHRPARAGAVDADAPQADLQSSLAMAVGRRL